MFSGAGSAGRRYGVNIDSLPPIDSLRAESLKDFSKEDLRCYLESVGKTIDVCFSTNSVDLYGY